MEKKVNIYICGEAGKWDDYNPFKVTQEEIVSEILYILNRKPLTVSQISNAIKKDNATVKKIIDSLLKINAVREDEGKYWVNFALLSKEDRKIILDIGKKCGDQLKCKLMEDKTELSNLTDKIRCANYMEKDKIIFALVGCFALDWYCLEELEKHNFLIYHKEQPGKRDYVLKGSEYSSVNVLLYTGSNSQSAGEYTFTSFGGGTAERSSFPDILWQALTGASDNIKGSSDLTEAFVNTLSLYGEELLRDCGRLIELLVTGKEIEIKNKNAILNLLEKLDFISQKGEHYTVKIPVFFPEDEEIIGEINKRVAKIVVGFIKQNYLEIKDSSSGIRPVLNKVPFGEIFSEVWHKIFGYCNRFLIEEGFMYDPPETAYNTRYLPWLTITKASSTN